MSVFPSFDYTDYLISKSAVDDSALHSGVYQCIQSELIPGNAERPVRILEAGAGVGTTVTRFLDWELFETAEYTAVDTDDNSLRTAERYLESYCENHGYRWEKHSSDICSITGENRSVSLELLQTDIREYPGTSTGEYDLVVAHAFLDIFPITEIVSLLLSAVRPGGHYYFTLNYNGVTKFYPEIDPALDRKIEHAYNDAMDRKDNRSGSRCGDELLDYLSETETVILESGDSNWEISPGNNGYSGDEKYFLMCILSTLEEALKNTGEIDSEQLAAWLQSRKAQLNTGELRFFAHHIDVCGKAE